MSIQTDADYIFFVSSSGHCSLDCAYCIVNPIVKHQPSLTLADLEYLLDQVQSKAGFIFSGKGDFFAGYPKSEKLLARLLERNVEIALDINGVMIHEFPELSATQLAKIRHINLTMHYRYLLDKKALTQWEKNALLLFSKKGNDNFMIGTILSPLNIDLWEESLKFYESTLFLKTAKKLVLIKDVLRPFQPAEEALLAILEHSFSHLIAEVRQEDFSILFKGHEEVLCPAGQRYFRIWNDGSVQGCPYLPSLENCGNLKLRTFQPHAEMFRCQTPKYCDCHVIASLDKMVFKEGYQGAVSQSRGSI